MNNREHRGPDMSFEDLRQHFLRQGFPDIARPILLCNRDVVEVVRREIPDHILKQAGESADSIQRLAARENELEIFSLHPADVAKFRRGEPILLRVGAFAHPEKRQSGGQTNETVEAQVKLALSVNTFVAIEVIRYLIKRRDGRRWTLVNTEAERRLVLERLADLPWPVEDHRSTKDAKLQHLRTLLRNGQRRERWTQLWGCPDLAKEIKASCKTQFSIIPKTGLDAAIYFHQQQVAALILCEARAEDLRRIENEVADRYHEQGKIETQGHRVILAGTRIHRYAADVLPAAFSGDLDPSELFFNLTSDRPMFHAMRIVGRRYRRQPISLDEQQTKNLISYIESATLNAGAPELRDENASRVVVFWRYALDMVMPDLQWQEFLCAARRHLKDGRDFRLNLPS